METLKLLALYWGIMLVCYLIAGRLRSRAESFAFLEKALTGVIVLLVFVMGLRMGANEEVTSNLGTIGLQSVIITIVVVGGSIGFVTLARKIFKFDKTGMPIVNESDRGQAADGFSGFEDSADAEIAKEVELAAEEENHGGGMAMTLVILAFVIIGMVAGYFVIPKIFTDVDNFQDISGDWLVIGICILLGFVGFNLGLTGNVFKNLKTVGIKVIIFPIAATLGSLIGGIVYGAVTSLSVGEGLAISAGFGWYTLAPSLITEAGFAVAGAISFMHNVIRETLGIVIIPLAAKKLGYLEATAIPGVAAMDVCLPIVEKSCREETVVYSFVTGALMCIAVPIIVPLAVG